MDRSFPRPKPFTWPHLTPRKLLPVYPPPQSVLVDKYPKLPSPPRKPVFHHVDGVGPGDRVPYTLSTHIIPAAYRRMSRQVPIPEPIPFTMPKAEKEKEALKLWKRMKDIRETPNPEGIDRVFWNCVNRYVRNDHLAANASGGRGETGKGKGITLFLAHATGFPKEIWEPTLGHLLSSSAAQCIDEIWSWESIQHGDSALVNADSLSAVFDWVDNTRDILNFLLHFLPNTPTGGPLPTHLPQLPAEETEHRRVHGFKERTFVTIGHSYGGCTSAIAAALYPQLYHTLVLIDPVILEPQASNKRLFEYQDGLSRSSLQRRETWESKKAALELFQKSGFFKAWDPSALRVYIECGLYDESYDPNHPSSSTSATIPNTTARLKMPAIQESNIFSEGLVPWEAWEHVLAIDERIEIRWIFPGVHTPDFGPPDTTQRRAWIRPVNCSNTRIGTARHLIPHEAPKELAADLERFIVDRFGPQPVRRAAL